ncbi:MAG: hypothetical protein FJ315_04455 [SAR202 cluster bacterium]|nr:hypothetical protein [SAR202 cluster bacterium]
MMPSLDHSELYHRSDPSGMRERLPDASAQARAAWQSACALGLPPLHGRATSVVVAGMGTSGVAGELASDLLHHLGVARALTVWRDYALPAWVDASALVIACSYSGATPETLSAYHRARDCGASVVAMTTGGELADAARRDGVPLEPIHSPWGGRHSLTAACVGIIGILHALGLVEDMSRQVNEAAQLLERQARLYAVRVPEGRNPAKALARRLWGKLPVLYGAGLMTGVARRWQYDLNENAKTWAITASWPELQHNAICGYHYPDHVTRSAFGVLLTSPHLPEVLKQRLPLSQDLFREAGIPAEVMDAAADAVGAAGLGPLAHQLGMVYLGSWTSYYLAVLHGVDPVASPALETMRRRVAPLRSGATARP